jgi:hypothetical protein
MGDRFDEDDYLWFMPRAPHNKSLDASGGSVFRIIIGPALLE